MFGIIGDPVSHSLSPLFQARFAEQHGIDTVYVPLRVMREDVAVALAGMWATHVEGFNVTVPHKESVAALVQMDEAATLIGAVNTVRRGTDCWQGTNTDWQAVREVLHGLGVDLPGSEALLIGAGGTARAVLHALAAGSVQRVYICNRSPERLNGLMQHAARTYPAMEVCQIAWEKEDVAACAQRCAVVINTTSIGLGEADAVFPFALGGKGVALDAVYAPDGQTPFVLAARMGGRKVVDGLPMLVAQGAASFAWWHGVQADVESVMPWLEERLGRCRADQAQ